MSDLPELNTFNAENMLADLGVAHLSEYFGVWAINEDPFRAAVDRVSGVDLRSHVAARSMEPGGGISGDYQVTPGGVAIIELCGPMMKQLSSLGGGCSTVAARRQLRLAASNPDVAAIVLRIDSPGGTVSGTKDLADDVAIAAKKKMVVAYIEDMGASAAYWIASQATAIHANATALVGSIGTFAVLYDFSENAKQLGVKVHVVRAGDFKGTGVQGTEITSEQLEETQRVIDELNGHFLKAISAGRKMPVAAVRGLADGRVHVGAQAKQLGLVDAVQSFDQTIAQLSTPKGRNKAMSQDAANSAQSEQATPQPASYQQIVAACKDADEKFVCSQLAASSTIEQARDNWTNHLASENRAFREQQAKNAADAQAAADAKAKEEAAQAKQSTLGVDPLGQGAKDGSESFSGDAASQWNEGIAAKMKLGMSRQRASAALNREKPGLRMQMLQAHNDQHKRPCHVNG